jgi:hypothetical protein
MRTISRFACEVCGAEFADADSALACEAAPVVPAYPAGMVFAAGTGWTLAVAEPNTPERDHGRLFRAGWSCHDYYERRGATPVPDDLPDGETLAWGAPLLPGNRPDPGDPTFERVLSRLRRAGVPVTIWDGDLAVSLADYLANQP